MSIYIGTSGWSYDHWHGVIYPNNIYPRERLSYYARRFQTVELNSSYYHWPADSSFRSWRSRFPDGFFLSIKAPGLLTHVQRLYQPERWLERIKKSLLLLGDRLGVLLVQLSPRQECDYARLKYFLEQVPPEISVCLEFRHPSWHQDAVFELLEQHGTAYCVMSGAHLPCLLRATADFVYVRLHGPDTHHLYRGSYSDQDLGWWAERILEWSGQRRDVIVYFNNDGEGHAVRNAETLKTLISRKQ